MHTAPNPHPLSSFDASNGFACGATSAFVVRRIGSSERTEPTAAAGRKYGALFTPPFTFSFTHPRTTPRETQFTSMRTTIHRGPHRTEGRSIHTSIVSAIVPPISPPRTPPFNLRFNLHAHRISSARRNATSRRRLQVGSREYEVALFTPTVSTPSYLHSHLHSRSHLRLRPAANRLIGTLLAEVNCRQRALYRTSNPPTPAFIRTNIHTSNHRVRARRGRVLRRHQRNGGYTFTPPTPHLHPTPH